MKKNLLNKIYDAHSAGKKQLAVLIDPDTPDEGELISIVNEVQKAGADLIFLGGSLLTRDRLDHCLDQIRTISEVPVILFPGSVQQISGKADAILFLSLISGRNPELLIGNHVIAAPYIKEAGLEVLPTGYMIIDSGRPTTATYMSGSLPIPYDKGDIAACTAMAGEMLGLKLIYMDGGSGAERPVSTSMISAVRESIDLPIIIGGGIRDAETAANICRAGADIVVVGNATEDDPGIIKTIAEAVHNSVSYEHLG